MEGGLVIIINQVTNNGVRKRVFRKVDDYHWVENNVKIGTLAAQYLERMAAGEKIPEEYFLSLV